MGECSAPLTCILYIYDLYYNRKLYVCQYVLENKINNFGKELMEIILGVICEDIGQISICINWYNYENEFHPVTP